MANVFKLFRGLLTNRLGETPVAGEPLWTTDEHRLYIGDGSTAGGISILDPVTIDTDGNVTGVESLLLNTVSANPSWVEGLVFWDATEKAMVVYNDESNVTQQIGRELYVRVYNNTASPLLDGAPVSVVGIGLDGVLQVDLTDSSDKTSALRYLGLVTHQIAASTYGYICAFGFVNDIDTSGLAAGSPIWVDPDNPGQFVQEEPPSPAWNIRCGGCSVSDAVNGVLFSRPSIGDNNQSAEHILNGAILDNSDIIIGSDGVSATCEVVHVDSPTKTKLSMMYSGEFRVADYTSSTIYKVTLTAGTDIAPQRNYVYFLDSSNTLEVSTAGFPTSEEYVPVADVMCQSVASVQTDGFYKVHEWTDHIQDNVGRGHLAHINEWIRHRPAQWNSGIVLTPSVAEGTPAAVIDLSYTSGEVYLLSLHAFPAINTISANTYIYLYNHPTVAYTPMDGLNGTDLANDANGDSLTNKNYSLVIWGVQSDDSSDCQYYANLPNGFYTTEANAISDADNTADYSIPSEYLGTGFLVTRLVMNNSGGNVQIVTGGTFDLRGTIPAATGGGVSGGAGVTLWTQLLDTENAYTGMAGLPPTVNSGESGLEFSSTYKADVINEYTLDAGVTIEGTLFKDGDVGIGITAPARKLHVRDSAQVVSIFETQSVTGFYFAFLTPNITSDTNTGFYIDGATDRLDIRTNNVQRITVEKTGNVGIANITPSEKLDVTGNIKASGDIFAGNTLLTTQDQFYMGTHSLGAPMILFDSGDKLVYQRTINSFYLYIGSVVEYTFGPTSLNLQSNNIESTGWANFGGVVFAGNNQLTVDDAFWMGALDANSPGLFFEGITYIAYDRSTNFLETKIDNVTTSVLASNAMYSTVNLFIGEQASAETDLAAYGQFWVKSNTPNIAMFTDDAGTDFELYQTSIVGISGTRAQFNIAMTDSVNFVYTTNNGSTGNWLKWNAIDGTGTWTDMAWRKHVTIENPTGAEDFTWLFTPEAVTLSKLRFILTGSSSPSVTVTLRHATTRDAVGTIIDTNTITSVSAVTTITAISDTTIPANSFIWIETTAQSGTVLSMHCTMEGTVDS